MKILLIEDNRKLAEYAALGLGKAGFVVDAVSTAGDGWEALAVGSYDAVVLDLGLPDRDGMDLLEEMRRKGVACAVLILTARDGVENRVNGLTAGADDYLVKPFAMAELVARLRALERRQGKGLEMTLCYGNVSFDPRTREARVGAIVLTLSRRERDALEYLIRRGGRVITRTALEEALYPMGEELASNAVDVLIHRLRKRLQDAGAAVVIVTMRGVGYMLSVKPS
ncbi:response regulator [Insolitispirillum peregrinum]|uniref:DNA-binding response regulator, OmpR family, contains REC and winged-helix (WHTH) domain n=1 Tax=Insolitispirillum peregrinum TaxID=80876 RepID=A0A1N7NHX0_9PROT|nr:response regulator transcription factor [Insolitispirillum peregrinum]SIS97912.1 DNA-binding response regulator, OmpR family, contains REC and winged-helix (wHTH) domain [Insolitispirillum peregrinum]